MAAYCFGAFFEIKTLLGLEVSNLLSRRKITLCPQSGHLVGLQRMAAESPLCEFDFLAACARRIENAAGAR
jgi:hypothetical protein